MGKHSVFSQIILLAWVLLPGRTVFNTGERWIHPEGWKVPDIAHMVKSNQTEAGIFGHDHKIVVETYRSPEKKYSYFDKKVGLEDGRFLVYMDCEVRVEADIVHVYKDQEGNVLLYFINCMLPERVVANDEDGFHNAGYSSSAAQFLLADLDKDGIFESQFTETMDFWNDITLKGIPEYFRTDPDRARSSVVYNLLQFKLSGKKIGIPRHRPR